MPKLIGISNTTPVYAIGLAGALSDTRFLVKEAPYPKSWMSQHRDAALIVGIHDPSDLQIVIELRPDESERVVIALVDNHDVDLLSACLQAGATGTISADASVEELSIVLEAALLHKTVLPAPVARSMSQATVPLGAISNLSTDELSLLRDLAAGRTVAELGIQNGYSEREIYRQLKRVYKKLGVQRRIDAILTVARWGLLDSTDSTPEWWGGTGSRRTNKPDGP